jgi:hypothetical protein
LQACLLSFSRVSHLRQQLALLTAAFWSDHMLTQLSLLCLLLAASQLSMSGEHLALLVAALAAISVHALSPFTNPDAGSTGVPTASQLHAFSDSQLERLYPAQVVRLCHLDRGGLVMFIALPDGRIASRFMPPARRHGT